VAMGEWPATAWQRRESGAVRRVREGYVGGMPQGS
jgi:hypothetical protein